MRTTVDLPDTLFRRAKATAAVRGVSLKDLVITAIERETQPAGPPKPAKKRPFPTVHLKHKKVLDLSGFNFDDLLP
jgi:hypothetical protein